MLSVAAFVSAHAKIGPMVLFVQVTASIASTKACSVFVLPVPGGPYAQRTAEWASQK